MEICDETTLTKTMETCGRRTKLRKSLLASPILLALALASSACLSRMFDPSAAGASDLYGEGYSLGQEAAQRHLDSNAAVDVSLAGTNAQPPEFTVCGRRIDVEPTTDPALREKYAACPAYDPTAPILVLEGYRTYGRTANQLRSFLNAVQYARDEGLQLGIVRHSWAMEVLLQFFLADDAYSYGGEGWEARVEEALCAKVFYSPTELDGRENVVLQNPAELFYYHNSISQDEYAASQSQLLRTLFRNYNTGNGLRDYAFQSKDNNAVPVYAGDMCAAIDALFNEEKSSAIYSVVHLRALEGDPGRRIMAAVSNATGCDPTAALEMTPSYVKSILAPLGMLDHPIVIITDGQRPTLVQRLIGDPELRKYIRVVPEGASWLGGDATLATMATAFVGNPASTFSHFIGKSRRALGLGHTYIYMAKDEATGEYTSVCGDECIFRREGQKDDAFLQRAASTMADRRHVGPFRTKGGSSRNDAVLSKHWYRYAGIKRTNARRGYRKPRLTGEQWKERQESRRLG